MKNANKQKNSISGNNTSGLGRKIALIAVAAVVVIAAAVFIGIRVYYDAVRASKVNNNIFIISYNTTKLPFMQKIKET